MAGDLGYHHGVARRRRRGDGSVFYSDSEKCWIARISIGTRDGRPVRHKTRAATERGARAALESLQRTYGAGGDLAVMTLDEYLAEWLKAHGPSDHAFGWDRIPAAQLWKTARCGAASEHAA